ncbi:unnamed protein product [Dibothriocephalus latus]|uniref:NADP-dependent oxidoreductase domain-containing protein n=1 Tax=Dibothriocephalus latus TaxID=60516 RepID=A0A3P7NU96_DIBLA|nr:unnamed protein product [Dibothriocephalus latus]
MARCQTFLLLNSGYKIPQLGFGTLMTKPHEVEKPLLWAIAEGYRHIDCARAYQNEVEVGRALWNSDHRRKDVRPACELSLRKFGLNYLDLYLIHLPVSYKLKEGKQFSTTDLSVFDFEDIPVEETWKGMEELVEAGLARSIGVSNFNKDQIDRILASCKIPPAVNQIEVSVNWLNQKLIDHCHSKGIQITGYAPFGSPGVMK